MRPPAKAGRDGEAPPFAHAPIGAACFECKCQVITVVGDVRTHERAPENLRIEARCVRRARAEGTRAIPSGARPALRPTTPPSAKSRVSLHRTV